MRTLIVYGSKHGATEKCSKALKDKLDGEVTIVNIKKNVMPDMGSFDNIVIGGSIYAGRIQKEIREFCFKNANTLKNKKIGIFVCCMSEGEKAISQLNDSLPHELMSMATAKEHFGGGFAFSKMNFFEKFIIKMVSKKEKNAIKVNINKDVLNIHEDNINRFVQLMNNK
ncbi:flavodoxin domain-containing protein [Clostridium tagluense]|uniref:flavodoxin domain-containing protein n=1 Tax=Clostridium tagluense TaxID=360422 RepID=UPI001CF31465|nr:flavodoxin domain-containing protein [Clostridium tagluense]MCB2300809.1 flavodoxin domain-containing protein [Clostridium tagluense]MCB2310844.1 flavodoxin domain-containing protein [Clostridium tagluense]MCB2315698.1 flavodoxin domain-containing protein [Clostridium tagluense]MCB2320658.1 flavodoxin domain-containing protein [Clostridium tagluense]MCB2325437.1 flavodoxin domain-containing protein [Clostridium tagluense]